ncbi:hypothetical protein G210_5124, partial [Candida maltosa Xu316]
NKDAPAIQLSDDGEPMNFQSFSKFMNDFRYEATSKGFSAEQLDWFDRYIKFAQGAIQQAIFSKAIESRQQRIERINNLNTKPSNIINSQIKATGASVELGKCWQNNIKFRTESKTDDTGKRSNPEPEIDNVKRNKPNPDCIVTTATSSIDIASSSIDVDSNSIDIDSNSIDVGS